MSNLQCFATATITDQKKTNVSACTAAVVHAAAIAAVRLSHRTVWAFNRTSRPVTNLAVFLQHGQHVSIESRLSPGWRGDHRNGTSQRKHR
jgi:hypothetical protein